MSITHKGTEAQMTEHVEQIFNNYKIPDNLRYEIYDLSKNFDDKLKEEIELNGTYNLIKEYKTQSEFEWEKYCILWNKRRRPGWLYEDEEDHVPVLFDSFIENRWIKYNKNEALYIKKNVKKMLDSDIFCESVSNYTKQEWEYIFETSRYKKVKKVINIEDTKKMLNMVLRVIEISIQHIEQSERMIAYRNKFETEEDMLEDMYNHDDYDDYTDETWNYYDDYV